MARFNEILTGRYSRALQRLFSMKGSAVSPILGTEFTPVVPIFRGAEDRFTEGWDLYAVGTLVAAVAGQAALVRLRNPVGSKVIAILQLLSVSRNGVGGSFAEVDLFSGIATTDLAVADGPVALDKRGRPGSTLIMSHTTGVAGAGGLIARLQMNASLITPYIGTDIQEFPLAPGSHVDVNNLTANEAFMVNFQWRERSLEESELT